MKFKPAILVSLVSIVVCSSVVLASGTETEVDTSQKPPLRGSRGMKPKQDLRSLPRQKTVLPSPMTPLPERSAPTHISAISAQ